MTNTAPDSKADIPLERFRSKWISLAFVILASITAVGATTAYWINQTLLDTDRFMEVVGPVLESEELAESLAPRVANQTVRAIGVEQFVDDSLQSLEGYLRGVGEALDIDPNGPVGERLPDLPDLTVLTDPIVQRVETRVSDLVITLVTSQDFQAVLDTVVSDAHRVAVVVVTGDESNLPPGVTVDGDVGLNLRPLIAATIVEVAAAGADRIGVATPKVDSGEDPEQILADVFAARNIEVPDDFGKITLLTEEQLAPYRDAVDLLGTLQWLLIILTLLFSFIAVWAHPNRVVGAVWLGIGIVVFQLIEWPLAAFVGDQVIASSTSDGSSLLATIVTTATADLLGFTVIVIIIGALIALGALFLTGWRASQEEPVDPISTDAPVT